RRAGAVGEVTGWAFDASGTLIEGLTNDRVASVRPVPGAGRRTICVAMGESRLPALRAALRGKLVNGLVTDERTAEMLLGD
ncbi:MAG: sugar-binding transcriptional regulator, partial [Paracoccaceae bacterium]|nr:sugar-binding transcriptional regulator [Paracoccaceae bacterium]